LLILMKLRNRKSKEREEERVIQEQYIYTSLSV